MADVTRKGVQSVREGRHRQAGRDKESRENEEATRSRTADVGSKTMVINKTCRNFCRLSIEPRSRHISSSYQVVESLDTGPGWNNRGVS